MDIIFWKGIIIGILVGFPSGPVGFITLRRAYFFGFASMAYSVLGAIATDAFYGVVIGFNLQVIANFLTRIAVYTEFIAGFALIGIWYSASREKLDFNNADKKTHPFSEFTSIAVITDFTPAPIFTFPALLTMIGMADSVGHPREIVTFLFGIAVGSMAFWYGIYRWINHFKQKNQDAHIQTAYTYSGRMLGIVGIILIVLGIIHLVF